MDKILAIYLLMSYREIVHEGGHLAAERVVVADDPAVEHERIGLHQHGLYEHLARYD